MIVNTFYKHQIYILQRKNIYDLLFEQQFLVPSVRSEIHKITFALAILS